MGCGAGGARRGRGGGRGWAKTAGGVSVGAGGMPVGLPLQLSLEGSCVAIVL